MLLDRALPGEEFGSLYAQELQMYLAASKKYQKAACGCRRVLDRQSGIENWLVVESHPCADHKHDPRIAFMWV